MVRFCDRPDEFRFAVRGLIDDAGGYIAGYDGAGVQVTLPGDRDKRLGLFLALDKLGAVMRDDSRYMFPACGPEPASCHRWKRVDDYGNLSAAMVEYATFDWTCPAGWESV